MPKGIESNALAGAGTAQGQAGSAYNTLNPIYQQMATDPQGFTAQQKANMLTASGQSLGGSTAAATGLGALAASRTNNAGGYAGAIDDATRNADVQQSQNSLGVENQDASLARQQQAQGLAGLSGIYNDANSTGLGYLNTANSASQANAANTMQWTKLGLQTLGGLAGA